MNKFVVVIAMRPAWCRSRLSSAVQRGGVDALGGGVVRGLDRHKTVP